MDGESIESQSQLAQLQEPLEVINLQAWRLKASPFLHSGELLEIANRLTDAAQQIGRSVTALSFEHPGMAPELIDLPEPASVS